MSLVRIGMVLPLPTSLVSFNLISYFITLIFFLFPDGWDDDAISNVSLTDEIGKSL